MDFYKKEIAARYENHKDYKEMTEQQRADWLQGEIETKFDKNLGQIIDFRVRGKMVMMKEADF